MFKGCSNLKNLNLSSFNTSNVTTMTEVFDGCTSLTSLDLSSFNTANLINMPRMFNGCENLTTIYVGEGWSTATVEYSNDMFYGCTNLVGGQGTTYDENHVDAEYAHIDGGPSNPGYFTAKNAGLRGDVNGDQTVDIDDVTALISYVLNGDSSSINMSAADCYPDGRIDIDDVTALISFVLNGTWN
jgi:surface protein